MYKQQVVDWSD